MNRIINMYHSNFARNSRTARVSRGTWTDMIHAIAWQIVCQCLTLALQVLFSVCLAGIILGLIYLAQHAQSWWDRIFWTLVLSCLVGTLVCVAAYWKRISGHRLGRAPARPMIIDEESGIPLNRPRSLVSRLFTPSSLGRDRTLTDNHQAYSSHLPSQWV